MHPKNFDYNVRPSSLLFHLNLLQFVENIFEKKYVYFFLSDNSVLYFLCFSVWTVFKKVYTPKNRTNAFSGLFWSSTFPFKKKTFL